MRRRLWRPRYVQRAHSSIPELVLKVIIALAGILIILLAVPRDVRAGVIVAVALVLLAIWVLNYYVRGYASGRPFWQLSFMLSEPLDYHTWDRLDDAAAQKSSTDLGILRVHQGFQCLDYSAVHLRATDVRGEELLVYTGDYTADGLRAGFYLRIAKFTALRRAAEQETANVATRS